MDKTIKFIISLSLFVFLVKISKGELYIKKRNLQETVTVNLVFKKCRLKNRYIINFSTNNKKNNFEILSIEKNIHI